MSWGNYFQGVTMGRVLYSLMKFSNIFGVLG